MIGWIYLIGGVVMWRPIFRMLRDDLEDSGPLDGADLAFAMGCASFLACLWPLPAALLLVRFALAGRETDITVIARKVGGESRKQKAERLERERFQRELYVAKLERELGIE